MADDRIASSVSLPDMVTCIDRELKFRLVVYPRWVDKTPPKMTPKTMNQELDRMRAVRAAVVRAAALQAVVDTLAQRAQVPMPDLVAMVEKEEATLAAQFQRCP